MSEPARPLGKAGIAMWDQVWKTTDWIDQDSDSEAVLLLCEALDERTALRIAVLDSANWRDRAALRALDAQIALLMDSLGLNPASRQRLAITTEDSPFDELARRRSQA